MSLTKVTFSMIDGNIVNCVDYGVDITGVADSTAALQAAISAAANKVLLISGVVKITATVNITSPIYIFAPNAKIDASTSNFYALNITSGNVTIDGLEIEGAGNASYNTNGRLIVATGIDNGAGNAPTYISNITVCNCNLHDAGRGGVYAAFVDNLKATNNRVTDVGYSGIQCFSVKNSVIEGNIVDTVSPGVSVGASFQAYGIETNRTSSTDLTQYPQCDNIAIAYNTVRNIPTWEGIDTHGGKNLKIVGNTVSDCFSGIAIVRSVDGSSTQIVATSNIIINENNISNCTRAGITTGAATPSHASIVIANNTLNVCGPVIDEEYGALRLFNINNLICENNTLVNSSRYGLIAQGLTFSSISGNVFQNIYSDFATQPSAIRINPSCSNLAIQGNVLNSTSASPYIGTYNNVYGLSFESSASMTDLMVVNNEFSDATNRAYKTNSLPAEIVAATRFQGYVEIAVTTIVSSATATITIPGPYFEGVTTQITDTSVRSKSAGIQAVVTEGVPTAYNQIQVTVRTANGSNFAASGSVFCNWIASGW